VRVTGLIAMRLLMHERGRNVLTMGGIFISILMIFLQLGFFSSVPKAGMLVYDRLRFDIILTSSSYVFQEQAYEFPRERLYQALALPEIQSAAPIYQGEASWLNSAEGLRRDLFVMGFRLADMSFNVDDIERQLMLLQRPDTVLVDNATLTMFGPQTPGHRTEINRRDVEIAGSYRLGTGFTGLGAVVTSDLNFARIFPERSLGKVNLGLLTLSPGGNPAEIAERLRRLMPPDIRVFTRGELALYEENFWRTRTSTGLIFGFGVVVSVIVGAVILYQALTTQVVRQLPQFATLRAIGYTDRQIRRIVLNVALLTAGIAFFPSWMAALATYAKVRDLARLPIEMTAARVIIVFVVVIMTSAATALVAVRKIHNVDPADLF
jgi:putative ABC transport system permease protein